MKFGDNKDLENNVEPHIYTYEEAKKAKVNKLTKSINLPTIDTYLDTSI